ncbi:hypothetical protein SLE2022_365400 [Rubroshorea leprosula]|uniref:Uncharacterized protein n=1 Tax=Rubroshorea leprosula TaxID=152421 RepID=A0AAV5KL49_9ROSI|nr:hypothetical protein SLEP1_g34679 [Rubroshorea leprosula]
MLRPEKDSNPKLRKKKTSAPKATMPQLERTEEAPQIQGSLPVKMGKKASKKNLKNDVSPLFQQPEQSNSDSLTDSYTSANEYRALRKKYLLLEEESSALGKELQEVEDDVRNLENEKLALLDRLVVLEGLMDPLEMQSNGV